jgi:hypothetical protein
MIHISKRVKPLSRKLLNDNILNSRSNPSQQARPSGPGQWRRLAGLCRRSARALVSQAQVYVDPAQVHVDPVG